MNSRLSWIRQTGSLSLTIAVVGMLAPASSPAFAQFEIEGRPVEIHGFVTQGFAYSNQNNYLTMQTSQGTFALTDAGLNASVQLTDKFRIGAQAYTRNIGDLGHGHVYVDWASGDYRFQDWFGIRAGKVKTVLGLYNDTQDLEFLHTWALLPQSLYPLDLRGTSIAHLGGDIYGSTSIGRLGRLSYTAYAGEVSGDRTSGIVEGLEALGINLRTTTGTTKGMDLRWATPLSGLLTGVSYARSTVAQKGVVDTFGGTSFRSDITTPLTVFYAQYSLRDWKVDGEYSRADLTGTLYGVYGPQGPPSVLFSVNQRAWYASVAYRVSKHIELGTYHSRFYPNDDRQQPLLPPLPSPARHIIDQVATVRLDFKDHWDLKIEEHFIDGYGDPTSFRGFYPQTNPLGLKNKTDLFIVRLGFSF